MSDQGTTTNPPSAPLPSSPRDRQTGAARFEHKALIVMVLGVAAVFATFLYFGPVLATIALVLAPAARESARSGSDPERDLNRVRIGVIASWISIGIVGLVALYWILRLLGL